MSKVQYGKFPLDALEEIKYLKKHGNFKPGDATKTHPNNAILLRHIGIIEDPSSKKTVKEPAKTAKQEEKTVEKKVTRSRKAK